MITEGSSIGITCERCGVSIKSGRFCERCKNKMANNLGSMYGESNAAVENMEKRARAEAKMRYFDS
jgi:hypothetical protein